MVEVASIDTNPSKLPAVEPIQAGKIDTTTTRCFDLFCVGKYEPGSDLKLNIQSAKKIPNLVTKDANGDPVFAEPKAMCTIQGIKGHNVWVKITLEKKTSSLPNYMGLGIKKCGEDDYFDVLSADNSSRYVDVLDTDTVELIPLVSSTVLPTYTPVKVGETAKIIDDINTYDFGSVYRVNVALHNSQWLTNQTCNAMSVFNTHWNNYSAIGRGVVIDQDGNTYQNQLFAIAQNGVLARSPDGIHWFRNSTVKKEGDTSTWVRGPVYGNGIWCTVSNSGEIRRSIDGGRSWSNTLVTMSVGRINFGNNAFMAVLTNGLVYTSPDAEIWTQVGKVNVNPGILLYGDGKWLCSSTGGQAYYSKDGGESWEGPNDGLLQVRSPIWVIGGSYGNGYFYAIDGHVRIGMSQDGENWYPIFNLSGYFQSVVYFRNKLWTYLATGSKYHVALPRPDGTIDKIEV